MFCYYIKLVHVDDYFAFLPPFVQQDPDILGGMVVDLGDKFIDMSTKTKIQKIVKTLGEGL